MNMIRFSSRQGVSPGGEESRGDGSDSEERERIIQRLPASVQAMLLRVKRTLSENELERISYATADHRYEALRMIFEGKSADEAVLFLLEVSDRTRASKVAAQPSTIPETTEAAGAYQAVGCHSSNQADISLLSPYATSGTCEKTMGARCQPFSSLQPTIISHCSDTADRSMVDSSDEASDVGSSNIVAVSPPQPFPHPLSTRGLSEIGVNTTAQTTLKKPAERFLTRVPVIAKRRSSAGILDCSRTSSKVISTENVDINTCGECESSIVSTTMNSTLVPCSVWNERYKTYIVHPNQLKRLQDQVRQISPPAVIRHGNGTSFRRQMTDENCQPLRQNTRVARPQLSPSKFRRHVSTDTSKGGMTVALRRNETNCPPGRVKQTSCALSAQPLKCVNNTKQKDNVFLRLYSNNTPHSTPRRATPPVRMCRTPTGDRLTPRVTNLQRTLSANTNHTPRCREKLSSFYSTLLTPSRGTPLHPSCRPRTPTRLLSARHNGVTSVGLNTPRTKMPTRKLLTAAHTPQRLQRAATAACFSSRFEQMPIGGARRGLHSAYRGEFNVQGRREYGRTMSASTNGKRLKRSATATAWH